ncbi:MAG: hypothetical protein K2K37_13245 [Muribaculaceae bacterium]|nr:hypothetical protein [Muribaculaceae bacterium]
MSQKFESFDSFMNEMEVLKDDELLLIEGGTGNSTSTVMMISARSDLIKKEKMMPSSDV